MRTLTLEVTDAIARRWDRLAEASRLPTGFWIAFCLHTCERLEFPVTQVIFRIPPPDRREAGVYWEVARFECSRSVRPGNVAPEGAPENARERLDASADHRRRLHAFAEEAR